MIGAPDTSRLAPTGTPEVSAFTAWFAESGVGFALVGWLPVLIVAALAIAAWVAFR